MIVLLLFLALFVFAGLWVATVYNSLILYKHETLNAWKQIDVQLKRRYDLIPNLVEAVKGAMQHEKDTLAKVVDLRGKAVSAQGVADKAAQEQLLSGALRQLFVLAENYPQLKTSQNVIKLQEELTSTENRIGFSRQFYNDIATKFNIAQQTFPTRVIAGFLGFKRAELFELEDGSHKTAPAVDLTIK